MLNIIKHLTLLALALYFVGYVLCMIVVLLTTPLLVLMNLLLVEVPANIVLKRFNPRIWLPTLTWVWGITSLCQGLVHNQAGLFSVRFFLGVAEAGLYV